MNQLSPVSMSGSSGSSPSFPIPLNEEARLQALRDLKILDTGADERFDRIVRLAQAHYQMPVVRITFVDKDRSWFKSRVGINAQEAPRGIAICSHAIMAKHPLVSNDLAQDPRFAASPQVTGKPHFRFYAGAPITLSSGFRVGSLCLMDYVPHPEFDEEGARFLTDLAEVVVHELELHRQLAERDDKLFTADRELIIAKEAKERFMAIISHELRTPLNGILGLARMIEDMATVENETHRYAQYAAHICDGALRLNTLIERILTYTSADAADLHLLETVFSWHDVIEDCLRQSQITAEAKDVTFTIAIASAAQPCFFGDEIQMREIIMQLVENAIAFSQEGHEIIVGVSVSEDLAPRLFVADTGKGIEQDKVDHILSTFQQGDDGPSREHAGIGMGLPITKALAELHGGRLQIDSAPRQGTCVQVIFPAARARQMQGDQ